MKKLVMAVVAALAVACAMADEPQRGPRRHRDERNGERRAQFNRPMPPPMMYGSGAMMLRLLSSKMFLERIGVKEEAQLSKITDAVKPLREESDKLEAKLRENSRAQSQAMSELIKDKAADPKAAMDKVDELEKLRAEQGRLAIKAILALRENLTAEQAEKDHKEMLEFVQETLKDHVSKVRVSTILQSGSVCLTAEGPISLEMEKYFTKMRGDFPMKAQRVLELNPESGDFKALCRAFEAGDKDKAAVYAEVLYNQALIIADLPLPDPARYAELVCGLME